MEIRNKAAMKNARAKSRQLLDQKGGAYQSPEKIVRESNQSLRKEKEKETLLQEKLHIK